MITNEPTPVWVVTAVLLALIVGLDLRVIARRKCPVSLASSMRWVAFYVGLALAFGGLLCLVSGAKTGTEFFSGYLTEYSLSVDNLFVFLVIITKLAVPHDAQDKVLYLGIVLSMALRAVFIVAGAALVSAASWSFYVFGALLLYTALSLLRDNDNPEFHEYAALRALRRILPIARDYHGRRILLRQSGRTTWTPMLIAIGAIGIANVMFALDSIPAIFGLTHDAFVILTANAFALMGLRQLYFLMGDLLQRLIYLNTGLSAVLAFIGAKLLLEALRSSGVDRFGSVPLPNIGTALSLTIIIAILATASTVSLVATARKRQAADHAPQTLQPHLPDDPTAADPDSPNTALPEPAQRT